MIDAMGKCAFLRDSDGTHAADGASPDLQSIPAFAKTTGTVSAMHIRDDETDTVLTAQRIATATDDEIIRTILQLRSSKRLSSTVHQLNALLSTQHRGIAMQALQRMGLGYSG